MHLLIQWYRFYDTDRLTDKAPEPKAGPNDVVVDVYSAALNFFGKIVRPQSCFVSKVC